MEPLSGLVFIMLIGIVRLVENVVNTALLLQCCRGTPGRQADDVDVTTPSCWSDHDGLCDDGGRGAVFVNPFNREL